MKMKLVSVYDAKAQVFTPPMAFPTIGFAERSFVDAVNDPQSQYNKHPEDYTLFRVGEFDDQTGMTENLDTPFSLGVALTFIKA